MCYVEQGRRWPDYMLLEWLQFFVSLAGIPKSGDPFGLRRRAVWSTSRSSKLLLPRWGITHTYVDTKQTSRMGARQFSRYTRMIFAETLYPIQV